MSDVIARAVAAVIALGRKEARPEHAAAVRAKAAVNLLNPPHIASASPTLLRSNAEGRKLHLRVTAKMGSNVLGYSWQKPRNRRGRPATNQKGTCFGIRVCPVPQECLARMAAV